MSTLEEIQAQIRSAKDELNKTRRLKELVEAETVQAGSMYTALHFAKFCHLFQCSQALHRQQMRRQLDVIRDAIHANQISIASSRAYRERIDSDSVLAHILCTVGGYAWINPLQVRVNGLKG